MAIRRAEEIEPRSPVALAKGGPTVLRILLGSQLRRLRQERGISREEAGYAIRASHAKISRLELGKVSFKERDVADLLTLYGVTDPADREPLLELARQANRPGWWHKYSDLLPHWFEVYVGLEEAASIIRTYEIQFIPGLLQSRDYARGDQHRPPAGEQGGDRPPHRAAGAPPAAAARAGRADCGPWWTRPRYAARSAGRR